MRSFICFIAAIIIFFTNGSAFQLDSNRIKNTIPFEMVGNQVMVIPIALGNKDSVYSFQFDTHAPCTFVSEGIFQRNSKLTFREKGNVRVRSVDEGTMKSEKYKVDKIFIGNSEYKDTKVLKETTSFTTMNLIEKESNYTYGGLVGLNLLRGYVWKIDFEKKMIQFENKIELIDSVEDKIKIGKLNLISIFAVDVGFQNDFSTKLKVDFGYNKDILLSTNTAKKIENYKNSEIKLVKYETITGETMVKIHLIANEPVKIGNKEYPLLITSKEVNGSDVLGLGFFKKFKYVILDYVDGAIYVSSEMRLDSIPKTYR